MPSPPPCPVCLGVHFTPRYPVRDLVLHSVGSWTFARCAGCGHGVLDPMPDGATLAALYGSLYTDENFATMRRANESGFDRRLRARRIRALRRVGVPDGPLRVVDVGCGLGHFLSELATELGAARVQAIGVELGAPAADAAEARLLAVLGPSLPPRVLREEFDVAGLAPGSVDVLTMNHFLEHVPDPRATLLRVAALLRPGGLAQIEVPRGDGWGPRLLGRWWWPHLPPQHLHLFAREGLEHTVRSVGLDVVHVHVSGYPLTVTAGWVAWVRATLGRSSPRAHSRVWRATAWVLGLLGLPATFAFDALVAPLLDLRGGDIVTVVARRPAG